MRVRVLAKRFGIAVIVLVTLGFLVVAAENYRGRRAWDRYMAEAEARGEQLKWKAFMTSAVPDDQNFAATPLLAPLFDTRWDAATGHLIYADSNRVNQLKSLFGWHRHLTIREPGWRASEPIDLAARQEALRSATNSADADLLALHAREAGDPAADLLFLLQQHHDELEEIRAAVQRPYSHIQVESYDEQLTAQMPYFAVVKSFFRAFQTKALAELAQGNTDAAAEDVHAIMALAGTLKHEPLLISGLVRMAAFSTVFQPLWEGLARRQWTDEQLAGFEAKLKQVNMIEEMAFWLRGERVFNLGYFASRKGQVDLGNGVDSRMRNRYGRMPAGWRYQNQVEIARMYDDYVLPVLHPEVPMVDLARNFELEQESKTLTRTWHPYRVMAMSLLPAVQKMAPKSAQNQADVHLARVACALERHYLAEGEYPKQLEDLAPRFLDPVPVDPVNGLSLHYRPIEGGRFVLYSVGSDLDDDGGRFPPVERAQRGVDCDWVWGYDAR